MIRMPLPKLQRFPLGGTVHEHQFLYEYGWPDEVDPRTVRRSGFDDRVRLQPGVCHGLASLAPLLRPLIQAKWAAL